MTGTALFDDFTDTVLGHHPDFIVGLANAAATVAGPAHLYCPETYLRHHEIHPGVRHRATTRRSPGSTGAKVSSSASADPRSVAAACSHAAENGATMFLNAYFDENYPAWPGPRTSMQHVHMLHRPGYFAADVGQSADPGHLARVVETSAADALVVVNTPTGARQASAFVDPASLVVAPWPTATRAEVDTWFGDNQPAEDCEPYVLSIGSARSDKGADVLLSALRDGPALKIIGQQYHGVEERIRREHPTTQVEWESGWVSRSRLVDVILRASVIVFPYQDEFAGYGGASGALAQALAAGKPVIVSDVLAEQVPSSSACRIVPATDLDALRHAVLDALDDVSGLHHAAAALRGHVDAHHTYEGFIETVRRRQP